jgi:hypothetical protein
MEQAGGAVSRSATALTVNEDYELRYWTKEPVVSADGSISRAEGWAECEGCARAARQ